MDAQATYMFQRNPNEQGPNGSPRPINSNNGNGSDGPNKNITISLIMRSLLIVVVVLLGWGLFQYFTQSSNSGPQDVLDVFFFFQAEDGIRDLTVTGVQTCALPI